MNKPLVEDGPDRKKFRVMLDNYEGRNLLNLRYWYKDKSTGEFKPTRQGITITATNYLAFKSVVAMHDEEVTQHLNQGSTSVEVSAAAQRANAKAAAVAREVSKMELAVDSFRPSTEMFKIEYEGGIAKITINKKHAIADLLDVKNASPRLIEIVSKLLVALDLSLFSAQHAKEASGAVVLELLKQELSANVTKYLKP